MRTCRDGGLEVSLFIDPNVDQVDASAEMGVEAVELHTGRYADATARVAIASELEALVRSGERALKAGMHLHAGHGLNYQNVGAVAVIEGMEELNIGHSIVARAVFVGMERAVREMKACIEGALLRSRR